MDFEQARKKAMMAVQERIEEMAIEQYDAMYESNKDEVDATTGVKVKGFCDHEKLSHW